ncbi:LysR family transcriptional regulator [Rahnella aquatilis]|uniref:Transcriptional regulator n=1 Tax=Rahnella aquatilis (strain ATCC 33071 / DSM 4594 / JCM 1683 / NBRC 105701 / NCIMB 13365 / CIP 78.65) TaxID=745277 RepID=H2IQM9_RAHAC|nr:LysR family transcriptional regulator [Rahnella aquatilis]AEX51330.1 transcriptional regulator [Rahnella aquatilis CIP 78.65 = ATCC 33071]KFD17414.1 LysR family transcriptional regulator [Rahnella aquatilis CIP 78.65 = ATCC 33071]
MKGFNQITIQSLRLYIAVLDQGSFSEVARREAMSPSTVSRVISQLEQALQTQLLYRNTRAVSPTESGKLLAGHARQVLAQLDLATLDLQEQDSEPGGLVRINAPVVFGQRHLAPWLHELSTRYPRLHIELMQTDDFVDPLQDSVDLLIRIGVMADSTLQARTLGHQTFRLAASPAYLARAGKPGTPEDLASHSCLVFKGFAGPQRWYFRQPDQEWHSLHLGGLLTSNNAETLTQAAIDGMGLVVFPTWLIGDALRDGRLVSVLESYQVSTSPEPQTISALYPNSRRPSIKVRAVIDFLVEKFGSPAYWE